MHVSFDLSHPNFSSKLGLLAITDPALHNSLLIFFADATGLPLRRSMVFLRLDS